jgi:hypothetical protein
MPVVETASVLSSSCWLMVHKPKTETIFTPKMSVPPQLLNKEEPFIPALKERGFLARSL